MRKISVIVFCLATVFASGDARADLTETSQCSGQSCDLDYFDNAVDVTFPQFNPQLGTLDSVSLYVSGNYDATVTLVNIGDTNAFPGGDIAAIFPNQLILDGFAYQSPWTGSRGNLDYFFNVNNFYVPPQSSVILSPATQMSFSASNFWCSSTEPPCNPAGTPGFQGFIGTGDLTFSGSPSTSNGIYFDPSSQAYSQVSDSTPYNVQFQVDYGYTSVAEPSLIAATAAICLILIAQTLRRKRFHACSHRLWEPRKDMKARIVRWSAHSHVA